MHDYLTTLLRHDALSLVAREWLALLDPTTTPYEAWTSCPDGRVRLAWAMDAGVDVGAVLRALAACARQVGWLVPRSPNGGLAAEAALAVLEREVPDPVLLAQHALTCANAAVVARTGEEALLLLAIAAACRVPMEPAAFLVAVCDRLADVWPKSRARTMVELAGIVAASVPWRLVEAAMEARAQREPAAVKDDASLASWVGAPPGHVAVEVDRAPPMVLRGRDTVWEGDDEQGPGFGAGAEASGTDRA